MFEYSICNLPDEEIFKKQCAALEKNVPGITKIYVLDDIDGSTSAFYRKDGKKITIRNSYYIGAVFIESEIELSQFFDLE